MKIKQLSYFCLTAMLALGMISCGSSGDDKSKNSDEFDAAEDSLKNQIEELVYNIPSPSEIPYMLQATGAEFNQSLINPRTKLDQFMTRSDKAAMNLGVYTADIGYLSSYDKTQEAIDYLSATKSLADNLNIIGSFDFDILQRFEANISNKDSLSFLLDDAVHQTERFLRDDNRNRLAALVITGGFIEGLYISTGLVKSYPKDILPDDARNLVLTPLIQIVLNQNKSVSELVKMLSVLEQTEPISLVMDDLKALDTTYAALNIEEQIRNNRADLVLSDKNLTEIAEIVSRVRKNIIE
jgi:hypothetical protein